MSLGNLTLYQGAARTISRRVFFSGTNVALIRGQGVCYDRTHVTTTTGQTATDAWGLRDKVVVEPTVSNNHSFAGVLKKDYPSSASGQWVEIYEPGSFCDVAIGAPTTIDTGILTCSASIADRGIFSRPGFRGRGSFRPLQTVSTAGSAPVHVTVGGGSLGVSLVLTDTGAFTTTLCPANTFGYILGSSVAATGQADATFLSEGKVKLTRIDDNTVTISAVTVAQGHDNVPATAPVAATAVSLVDYIILPGQKSYLCFGELLDGEESGLQEYRMADDTDTPQDLMPGGVSFLGASAGLTMGAFDYDLVPQPLLGGLQKGIIAYGEASTSPTITFEAGMQGWAMDGTVFVSNTLVGATGDYANFLFDHTGLGFQVIATDMTEG